MGAGKQAGCIGVFGVMPGPLGLHCRGFCLGKEFPTLFGRAPHGKNNLYGTNDA